LLFLLTSAGADTAPDAIATRRFSPATPAAVAFQPAFLPLGCVIRKHPMLQGRFPNDLLPGFARQRGNTARRSQGHACPFEVIATNRAWLVFSFLYL
jgi:hypothetical protein